MAVVSKNLDMSVYNIFIFLLCSKPNSHQICLFFTFCFDRTNTSLFLGISYNFSMMDVRRMVFLALYPSELYAIAHSLQPSYVQHVLD